MKKVSVVAAALVMTMVAALGPATSAGASSIIPTKVPDQGSEIFASDVYVVTGTGNLVNPDPRTTADSAALFNVAGEPLNVTWGGWRGATASAVARTVKKAHGEVGTDIRLQFHHLVAGGVYSLFYDTFQPDSSNPVCPAPIDNLVELTANDAAHQRPGPAPFVSSRSGSATFDASVAANLLAAQQVNLVVIYDFDGQTYGASPNRGENVNCDSTFGDTTMRQVLVIQQAP